MTASVASVETLRELLPEPTPPPVKQPHPGSGAAPAADRPPLDADACWATVVARDASADGRFVFGVTTTGIFCRPGCPARRPQRVNVRFYHSPLEARRAGFRPCRRCHPEGEPVDSRDLELVRRACALLVDPDGPATHAALAARLGVGPGRLVHTFSRLTGLTPRQYADSLRVERFKRTVREGGSVTDALYDAGYGSSSRLYERASDLLGMTPATYGRGGQGMRISFGMADAPLGRLLLGVTERGICAVRLGEDDASLEAGLRAEYPRAEIVHERAVLAPWLAEVLAGLDGARQIEALPVDIRATAFQRRVWQALRRIPPGETRSYSQIARSIGQPTAVRAVARACATNPVALVVPCHRAIRDDGSLAGYRWGIERKELLIARETDRAQRLQEPDSEVSRSV
jgi:AraC family transcriptional regulator of adaptative response/methylated-DNA-[protein]-cysteine methyltransferase